MFSSVDKHKVKKASANLRRSRDDEAPRSAFRWTQTVLDLKFYAAHMEAFREVCNQSHKPADRHILSRSADD